MTIPEIKVVHHYYGIYATGVMFIPREDQFVSSRTGRKMTIYYSIHEGDKTLHWGYTDSYFYAKSNVQRFIKRENQRRHIKALKEEGLI